MKRPRITKGQDFTLDIQIGTEPYSERLKIASSTAANPAVITTELPHQLATNDLVRISGHRKNTIVNGTHVATVITAFTFSVPVTGSVAGESDGFVSLLKDVSLYTFTVAAKSHPGGDALADVTATISVTDAVNKIVTISVAKTSTVNLTSKTCLFVVTYVDDAGKTHIFTVSCDVLDA